MQHTFCCHKFEHTTFTQHLATSYQNILALSKHTKYTSRNQIYSIKNKILSHNVPNKSNKRSVYAKK